MFDAAYVNVFMRLDVTFVRLNVTFAVCASVAFTYANVCCEMTQMCVLTFANIILRLRTVCWKARGYKINARVWVCSVSILA